MSKASKRATRLRIERRRFILKNRRHRKCFADGRPVQNVGFGLDEIVRLPESITLTKNGHGKVTRAVAALRHAFRVSPGRICVSFEDTTALSPEGLVFVYSELYRLRQAFPDQVVRCIPAKPKTVSQVLQHLGVYELVNYAIDIDTDRADVVQWNKCHSTWVDGKKAGELIEKHMKLTKDQARLLFEGVSEAITNVKNHAYLKSRNDGLRVPVSNDWWMFSRESEDSLYFCVCDLGIGIPRSLPAVYGHELVAKAVSAVTGGRKANDGATISAAMALSRSRTKAAHRGKGFKDMLDVADAVKGSIFAVISNKGALVYKDGIEKVHDYPESILGTIVIWQLPLGDHRDSEQSH